MMCAQQAQQRVTVMEKLEMIVVMTLEVGFSSGQRLYEEKCRSKVNLFWCISC